MIKPYDKIFLAHLLHSGGNYPNTLQSEVHRFICENPYLNVWMPGRMEIIQSGRRGKEIIKTASEK